MRLTDVFVAAATLITAVSASNPPMECGRNIGKCPGERPCCQQYGACGVGAYCLGGCDALWSNSLDSCMPIPTCQSKTYTFKDKKRIIESNYYLGDANKYDFVTQGQADVMDDMVWLTMAPDTVGTVLSTTREVFYGKVKAKMRTSRGAGVVTAFILFSGVKDEIDFEWVGTELDAVQTNYYWQGVPDYTHGGKTQMGNTYNQWHEYEIDWSPERIVWRVDGQEARTVNKKDTWNSTRKDYDYPQTPSRVQLSIWPGGLATNAKGTIDWAGGEITWSGPDIDKFGMYYALVKEVSIECYDAPSFVKREGSTSYIYTDNAGLDKSIKITDKKTVMKSLLSTGTDTEKEPEKVKEGTKPTNTIAAIPGLDGVSIDQYHRNADKKNNNNNGGGDGGDNGGEGAEDDGTDATTDFIQNGNRPGASAANPQVGETAVRGSLFAVAVALLAITMV